MKIRGFLFLALIALVAVWAFTSPGDDSDKDEVLMQSILSSMNKLHYEPLEIDDDFSERAFKLYLESIDGTKRFLTIDDVTQLEKYKLQIDDQVSAANFEFFELSRDLINKRTDQIEGMYKEILDKPFDFTIDERFEFDEEKVEYAKDEAQLKDYWRKALKYRVLDRVVGNLEKQEKAANGELEEDEKEEKKKKDDDEKDVLDMTFEELEAKARKDELKVHDDWFERLSKLRRSDRLETYINAVTSSFDPHTNYFPPKDKEDFDIRISGRLEGIGAQLRVEDGDIKVIRIVPGSASWRQKELEAKDIITAVAQGEEEPVDVVGMRLDDAVRLIRGKKGTEVRLTVKKVDGSTKVIPITRDIVVLEESYAKSTILNTEGTDYKVGLINLPQFYADFTKTGGRNCAEDVDKELKGLIDEGVSGVILDLRNNGGGSLNEVVDMSGLFIEKGPIVQVKGKDAAPRILRDKNSKVTYDGPLVIMINSGSASASEILAAAMQDYGRAVVVGSNSFGKGTVQRFINLDRTVPAVMADVRPLGSVKMTTQKFYRINGKTTQLKGVAPDIALPYRYDYIDTGEKEHDFPMAWDVIESVEYDTEFTINNIDKIKQMSALRVNNNETFALIDERAKLLKEERDNPNDNLNLEKFRKYEADSEAKNKKYEDLGDEVIAGLAVATPSFIMPSVEADSAQLARVEEWHESLGKDVYVEEALHVINDIIKNNK